MNETSSIDYVGSLVMALTGTFVVFLVLILVAVIISQLSNVLWLWEKPERMLPGNWARRKKDGDGDKPSGDVGGERSESSPGFQFPTCGHTYPENNREIVDAWMPMFEKMGDSFRLMDLYKEARESGLPHPHLTICRLRRENYLIQVENQLYTFRREPEE